MANATVNRTMYVRHLDQRHTLNVEVKITREFKFRLAVAKVLIMCAAYILGCGIDIKEAEE